MNISKIFITRPVATTVLIAAIAIFGFLSYRYLPVNELPNVDYPTILVTASVPGANPETMANTVATPIEKQFSTISGIDSMSSVSSTGSTQITLQFSLKRNIDAAAQDVQSALSQVVNQLPKNMTSQPVIRKINPAEAPILYLALTAHNLNMTDLDNYAENDLSPKISMSPGVAQVYIFGSQQYAVRILVDPNALTNRDLTINDVATAVPYLNTNQPSGTLLSHGSYHLLKINGQLLNAKQFSNAIIKNNHGAPVYLKEVAKVENSVANTQALTWYNHQRSIVLAIQRQPGANTVEVVNHIIKILPSLTSALPGGAKLSVVYNRANFIHDSIDDVEFTLIFSGFLVVLVVFIFLSNFSSAIISLFSLPVSIIATFGIMYLLSYSLDNLSLMGLILAVGFVIDDAVVVLENITRHIEFGLDRLTASLKGSNEVFFTVVAMTLSLVAVFIPIFFMGGMIGRLFREFAGVVGIAILASGVLALTFIPMLCSRWLTNKNCSHPIFSAFENNFNALKSWYGKTLMWSLNHIRLFLWISCGILILTGILFYVIPKGFMPSEDTSRISGSVEAPIGINFSDFVSEQQQAAHIILNNKNVKSLISSVGQGSGGIVNTNTGHFFILLKQPNQRHFNINQVIQQLHQQLSVVSGLKIYLKNPPAIQLGGKISNSTYQYTLQSTSWNVLKIASNTLLNKISKIKGVTGVNSDLELNNPELKIHIFREQAAALGVTPDAIENALYTAYGPRIVSTIMTASGEYNVIIEVNPTFQQNPNDLNFITVRSSTTNALVPISSVATETEGVGPAQINHYAQLPSVTISFDLMPGYSLGDITNQIKQVAHENLPPGVSAHFIGAAQTFEASLITLPILLIATILIIYMVLAILYEHFIYPLVILTALPFAVFGALISLFIFHQELNLFSFIGLIMLVGLTKKNGIMMVDFALDAQRQQKLPPIEAIYHASLMRFRPIMMTTVAALIATLPLALAFGASGEMRRALGIAVVGGLLFSQIITLYITPIFYVWMSAKKNITNTLLEFE